MLLIAQVLKDTPCQKSSDLRLDLSGSKVGHLVVDAVLIWKAWLFTSGSYSWKAKIHNISDLLCCWLPMILSNCCQPNPGTLCGNATFPVLISAWIWSRSLLHLSILVLFPVSCFSTSAYHYCVWVLSPWPQLIAWVLLCMQPAVYKDFYGVHGNEELVSWCHCRDLYCGLLLKKTVTEFTGSLFFSTVLHIPA